jgi:hypothetical protein
MSAALSTLDVSYACDVFISHAGEHKIYVDCLRRILQCVGGGVKRRQSQRNRSTVLLDQRSLETGSTTTPWAVTEREARHCRIGA